MIYNSQFKSIILASTGLFLSFFIISPCLMGMRDEPNQSSPLNRTTVQPKNLTIYCKEFIAKTDEAREYKITGKTSAAIQSQLASVRIIEEARRAYPREINLIKEQQVGYSNLGLLYQESGELDEALTWYNKKLTLYSPSQLRQREYQIDYKITAYTLCEIYYEKKELAKVGKYIEIAHKYFDDTSSEDLSYIYKATLLYFGNMIPEYKNIKKAKIYLKKFFEKISGKTGEEFKKNREEELPHLQYIYASQYTTDPQQKRLYLSQCVSQDRVSLPEAHLLYGELLALGKGGDKEPEKAFYHFKIACKENLYSRVSLLFLTRDVYIPMYKQIISLTKSYRQILKEQIVPLKSELEREKETNLDLTEKDFVTSVFGRDFQERTEVAYKEIKTICTELSELYDVIMQPIRAIATTEIEETIHYFLLLKRYVDGHSVVRNSLNAFIEEKKSELLFYLTSLEIPPAHEEVPDMDPELQKFIEKSELIFAQDREQKRTRGKSSPTREPALSSPSPATSEKSKPTFPTLRKKSWILFSTIMKGVDGEKIRKFKINHLTKMFTDLKCKVDESVSNGIEVSYSTSLGIERSINIHSPHGGGKESDRLYWDLCHHIRSFLIGIGATLNTIFEQPRGVSDSSVRAEASPKKENPEDKREKGEASEAEKGEGG